MLKYIESNKKVTIRYGPETSSPAVPIEYGGRISLALRQLIEYHRGFEGKDYVVILLLKFGANAPMKSDREFLRLSWRMKLSTAILFNLLIADRHAQLVP